MSDTAIKVDMMMAKRDQSLRARGSCEGLIDWEVAQKFASSRFYNVWPIVR
jgi:hypothetical protein